jgi:hypothetical protein
MDPSSETPSAKVSSWLASLPATIDASPSLEGLVELTQSQEAVSALSHPSLASACERVSSACSGEETLILSCAATFEAQYSRQQDRILVLTSAALYRLTRLEDGKDQAICARVPLEQIRSVEGAAFGWVLATSEVDPEGESPFARLWKDYIQPPAGNRFERTYWIDVDGVDDSVVHKWRQQAIPLVCSAIRAAVRLALSGTPAAESKIAGLRGERRWHEGGQPAEQQMTKLQQSVEAA